MFKTFFVRSERLCAVDVFHSEVELMVSLAQFVWHGFRIIHFAEGHVEVLVTNIENILRQSFQFLFLGCCQLREGEGVVA